MGSSTNIYIDLGEKAGANIPVTMSGEIRWKDINNNTPINEGDPGEQILRKHVESMENAVWQIFGLEDEALVI